MSGNICKVACKGRAWSARVRIGARWRVRTTVSDRESWRSMGRRRRELGLVDERRMRASAERLSASESDGLDCSLVGPSTTSHLSFIVLSSALENVDDRRKLELCSWLKLTILALSAVAGPRCSLRRMSPGASDPQSSPSVAQDLRC
ncbi:hypothetical protein OH77DRAFT_1297195 [Trametes cingulata]|nr:hypothetical protein OH77DRAFT_1297195 [Trametes cingulata]